MSNTFECPHCGAVVPVGARACPVCGSDEETGWSEEAEFGYVSSAEDDEGILASSDAGSVPWLPVLIGVLALVAVAIFIGREQLVIPILLLAALGSVLLARRSRSVGPVDRETALYHRLLMRARGDEALVERLVAYEAEKNPAADRAQHLVSALERWERDAR